MQIVKLDKLAKDTALCVEQYPVWGKESKEALRSREPNQILESTTKQVLINIASTGRNS